MFAAYEAAAAAESGRQLAASNHARELAETRSVAAREYKSLEQKSGAAVAESKQAVLNARADALGDIAQFQHQHALDVRTATAAAVSARNEAIAAHAACMDELASVRANAASEGEQFYSWAGHVRETFRLGSLRQQDEADAEVATARSEAAAAIESQRKEFERARAEAAAAATTERQEAALKLETQRREFERARAEAAAAAATERQEAATALANQVDHAAAEARAVFSQTQQEMALVRRDRDEALRALAARRVEQRSVSTETLLFIPSASASEDPVSERARTVFEVSTHLAPSSSSSEMADEASSSPSHSAAASPLPSSNKRKFPGDLPSAAASSSSSSSSSLSLPSPHFLPLHAHLHSHSQSLLNHQSFNLGASASSAQQGADHAGGSGGGDNGASDANGKSESSESSSLLPSSPNQHPFRFEQSSSSSSAQAGAGHADGANGGFHASAESAASQNGQQNESSSSSNAASAATGASSDSAAAGAADSADDAVIHWNDERPLAAGGMETLAARVALYQSKGVRLCDILIKLNADFGMQLSIGQLKGHLSSLKRIEDNEKLKQKQLKKAGSRRGK